MTDEKVADGQGLKTSWSSEEWSAAVTKFCPLTRKPCTEKIDLEGGGNPENVRECVFYSDGGVEPEGCRILHLLGDLKDGPLINILGVYLYKQIFGQLPPRDHWKTKDGQERIGFWEWMI